MIMINVIRTTGRHARRDLEQEFLDQAPADSFEDVARAIDDVVNHVDHGCKLVYCNYLDLELIVESGD